MVGFPIAPKGRDFLHYAEYVAELKAAGTWNPTPEQEQALLRYHADMLGRRVPQADVEALNAIVAAQAAATAARQQQQQQKQQQQKQQQKKKRKAASDALSRQ